MIKFNLIKLMGAENEDIWNKIKIPPKSCYNIIINIIILQVLLL